MKIRWSGILPVVITGVLFGLWQRSVLASLFIIWALLSLASFFAWHAETLNGAIQKMWERYTGANKDFPERAAVDGIAASLPHPIMSWGKLEEENPEEFQRLWTNRKSPAELAKSMHDIRSKSR